MKQIENSLLASWEGITSFVPSVYSDIYQKFAKLQEKSEMTRFQLEKEQKEEEEKRRKELEGNGRYRRLSIHQSFEESGSRSISPSSESSHRKHMSDAARDKFLQNKANRTIKNLRARSNEVEDHPNIPTEPIAIEEVWVNNPPKHISFFGQYITLDERNDLIFVMTFLVCAGVCIGTGGLLGFHIYLVCTNQTTIEIFEATVIREKLG